MGDVSAGPGHAAVKLQGARAVHRAGAEGKPPAGEIQRAVERVQAEAGIVQGDVALVEDGTALPGARTAVEQQRTAEKVETTGVDQLRGPGDRSAGGVDIDP